MERAQLAAASAAVAEETMAQYDASWFHRCVLLPPSPPPPPARAQAPPKERETEVSTAPSPTAGLRHRRTRSDEATAAAFQRLEPLRIPNTTTRARLETILSGKDGTVAAPQPRRPVGRHRCRRRGRSMSELEFEELQGLQDLGFTFSGAEVDAALASIVPGLRRRSSGETSEPVVAAAAEEGAAAVDEKPRRPYLSEAWDDEEEQVRAVLRDWRVPVAAGDGGADDMKQRLLVWAHTVASAVQ